MKSYLVIICPNSYEKFTKYEIRSKLLFALIWSYVHLFAPKIPFLPIFSLSYLHLPLFTYIWSNVALITLIWSYLPLIALIWPCVPYSPLDRYSSIETAPLCKIWEQSDNFSCRYCISKNWGILKVLSRMQLMCLFSIFGMYLLMLYPCIKFNSNRTIGYGDIAFQIYGEYCKCRHECSCSNNQIKKQRSF